MRPGGRRVGTIVAALAAAGLGVVASAQGAPFTGPLTLPETLRGTVRVPQDRLAGTGTANTLRALYPVLAACWTAPADAGDGEITTRFSLRRDGSVIGTPRVTYARPASNTRAARILSDAALRAIRRCTPARITPALGAAIAGRPIALRFVYQGPKGKGV